MKIKTHIANDKGRPFAWMALLTSVGFASFMTVLAVTLSQKIGNDAYVGYFFSFIAIIALITSLASTVLLRKYSKVTISKVTLVGACITFFLFTFAANIWHYLIFDMLRAISITLFTIILAIFVRDFAKEKEIALAEGRYYFFGNIGWVIGPFLGGFLAEYWNKEAAFIFSGIIYFITLLYFLHQNLIVKNPHIHHRKEPVVEESFSKNITDFFREKERVKSFFVAMGLYFWWVIHKVYIPITIIHIGYSQGIVGIVISASMIPLILLEVWVTKKAQTGGIKKYMTAGYIFLSVITFAFYATQEIPFVMLTLMVIANIGTAFIEPLHEAYFFQITPKKDEERFYGIYIASNPIVNIIGPLIGAIILTFTDISDLWIFCAMIFMLMAGITFSLGKKTSLKYHYQALKIWIQSHLLGHRAHS
ncbi:MAG: MFS transporter [Bacteroidota bacterium]